MSVSKWAYDPKKCDGDFCIGSCDYCSKALKSTEDVDDAELIASLRNREMCLYRNGWTQGYQEAMRQVQEFLNSKQEAE